MCNLFTLLLPKGFAELPYPLLRQNSLFLPNCSQSGHTNGLIAEQKRRNSRIALVYIIRITRGIVRNRIRLMGAVSLILEYL